MGETEMERRKGTKGGKGPVITNYDKEVKDSAERVKRSNEGS